MDFNLSPASSRKANETAYADWVTGKACGDPQNGLLLNAGIDALLDRYGITFSAMENSHFRITPDQRLGALSLGSTFSAISFQPRLAHATFLFSTRASFLFISSF